MRKNLLAHAVAVALLALSAKAAQGQVMYDSGGFEAPRFSTTATNVNEPLITGDLRGQDAPPPTQWFYSATTPNTMTTTTASASIINSTGGPIFAGLQSVAVTRDTSDARWAPVLNFNPASGIVKITWAMDVATETDQSNFGPFFGIEAYAGTTGAPVRLAMAGIDASTGQVLYFDNGPSQLGLTSATNGNPGTGWHTYELDLNYTTQQYSVFLDGSPTAVVLNTPFEAAGTQFIDAPITTTLAQPGGNQTGTAFFDNYVVSLVPEPGAIGLFVIGVLTLKRRRMI